MFRFAAITLTLITSGVAVSADPIGREAHQVSVTDELLMLAQAYSCSPRKTCSKTVRSCDEAYWLMNNCSWGGRLDGDNDGVPCENLCPGG